MPNATLTKALAYYGVDATEADGWFVVDGMYDQDALRFAKEVGSPAKLPLPFPRTGACVMKPDTKEAVLVRFSLNGKDAEVVGELFTRANAPTVSEDKMSLILTVLHASLMNAVISIPQQAHIATPVSGTVNAKRVRNGKKPLFTWTTVTITPPKPHAPPQGGHHASPRLHDRRGHYRTYKSGKRVWIKNCKVGKAADGIGFHDYKVPNGTTQLQQSQSV